MVRLIDLSTTLTATLFSTLALSSPLPQQDDVLADQSISAYSTAEPTLDVQTNVIFTTYTTVVYVTNTFTTTLAPAPTVLVSTTPDPLTNPDEPRLTTGTDTITNSFGPDLSRSGPSFHTVPSSFQNASATLFANTTILPQSTTVLNSTTLSNATTSTALFANTTILSQTTPLLNATTLLNATNPTTILRTSTSSTLATVISITSVTVPVSTSTAASTPAAVSSVALASTTCRPAAIPEAPVNDGTVEDCTLYYVAQPGDYCYAVAQQFDISVDTFMEWNPSVVPPTCQRMIAGDAYCVQVCGAPSSSAILSATSIVSTTLASTSALATLSTSSIAEASSTSNAPASPTSTLAPLDVYRAYTGDGTAAAGWPTESQWVSFAYMFIANSPNMRTSCDAWGVPNNSAAEMAALREQILLVGEQTGVDPRFILAIIMQESTGCVRVITTAYAHANPGLMQSFNGTGSCNSNSANINVPGVDASGTVLTPCPEAEIRQMILDGTNGTVWGPGLVQDLEQQGATDSSRWYRAARLYNGGAIVEGDLTLPCCTASYASDIANRLTGWVNAPRVFV